MIELPEYDLVVHLCGGQTLPIYYGTQILKSPRHLLAVTPESKSQYNLLKPLVEKNGAVADRMEVHAYDPAGLFKALVRARKKYDARKVAVNLTGGTKLMFVGGQETMRSFGWDGYYLETATRKMHLLHAPAEPPLDLPPIFDSVNEFFTFAQEKICESGHWKDEPLRQSRLDVTNHFAKQPALLSALTQKLKKREKELVKRNRNSLEISKTIAFREDAERMTRGAKESIAVEMDDKGNAKISLSGKNYDILDCIDFFDYLTGRWFEEYCYQLLLPLLRKGEIKDMRIGLKTKVNTAAPHLEPEETLFQDLDLCYTDGHELYVVECKSGKVKQDAVQKLENICRKYGGIQARGILASCFNPQKQYVRIDRSNRLWTVFGKKLPENLPAKALDSLRKA